MEDQLAPYLGDEACIRLIQCFLDPELMLCHPEPPKPLSELVPGARRCDNVERNEKKIDHLFELFTNQQIGKDVDECLTRDVYCCHSLIE